MALAPIPKARKEKAFQHSGIEPYLPKQLSTLVTLEVLLLLFRRFPADDIIDSFLLEYSSELIICPCLSSISSSCYQDSWECDQVCVYLHIQNPILIRIEQQTNIWRIAQRSQHTNNITRIQKNTRIKKPRLPGQLPFQHAERYARVQIPLLPMLLLLPGSSK